MTTLGSHKFCLCPI